MASQQQKQLIWVSLGVGWCGVVMVSYLSANTGYYAEKITAFGGYFLRILGSN